MASTQQRFAKAAGKKKLQMAENKDVQEIITLMKSISYHIKSHNHKICAINKLKRAMFMFIQSKGASLNEFYKNIIQQVDVLKSYRGGIGTGTRCIKDKLEALAPPPKNTPR